MLSCFPYKESRQIRSADGPWKEVSDWDREISRDSPAGCGCWAPRPGVSKWSPSQWGSWAGQKMQKCLLTNSVVQQLVVSRIFVIFNSKIGEKWSILRWGWKHHATFPQGCEMSKYLRNWQQSCQRLQGHLWFFNQIFTACFELLINEAAKMDLGWSWMIFFLKFWLKEFADKKNRGRKSRTFFKKDPSHHVLGSLCSGHWCPRATRMGCWTCELRDAASNPEDP